MTTELLHDFEALLVHKHRFALSDVIICLRTVIHDLQNVQNAVTVEFSSDLSSDTNPTDLLPHVSSRLERLVGLVPTFPGKQELMTLLSALQDFGRLSDGLGMNPRLHQSMETLSSHTKALATTVIRNAGVCALLTEKRQHLDTFLTEAGKALENSHSRRVEQYQDAIELFTEEYRLGLQDEHLQRAKQLHFDIQTIETSMSTMLLPHFEICRAITTANAQVQPTGSTFSKRQCDEISEFVQTAARLKSGDITFRSVLEDATQFLAQLALFEEAASKDAFLVYSSALQLKFRESLDQELFCAYVEDWGAKCKALQSTDESIEYQEATSRLQHLKSAIERANELAQASQEKLALAGPARESLAQEVARIFHDEGGVITQVHLPGCAK